MWLACHILHDHSPSLKEAKTETQGKSLKQKLTEKAASYSLVLYISSSCLYNWGERANRIISACHQEARKQSVFEKKMVLQHILGWKKLKGDLMETQRMLGINFKMHRA